MYALINIPTPHSHKHVYAPDAPFHGTTVETGWEQARLHGHTA